MTDPSSDRRPPESLGPEFLKRPLPKTTPEEDAVAQGLAGQIDETKSLRDQQQDCLEQYMKYQWYLLHPDLDTSRRHIFEYGMAFWEKQFELLDRRMELLDRHRGEEIAQDMVLMGLRLQRQAVSQGEMMARWTRWLAVATMLLAFATVALIFATLRNV